MAIQGHSRSHFGDSEKVTRDYIILHNNDGLIYKGSEDIASKSTEKLLFSTIPLSSDAPSPANLHKKTA